MTRTIFCTICGTKTSDKYQVTCDRYCPTKAPCNICKECYDRWIAWDTDYLDNKVIEKINKFMEDDK